MPLLYCKAMFGSLLCKRKSGTAQQMTSVQIQFSSFVAILRAMILFSFYSIFFYLWTHGSRGNISSIYMFYVFIFIGFEVCPPCEKISKSYSYWVLLGRKCWKTEVWINDAENSALPHWNKLHLKVCSRRNLFLNYNIISKYYYFDCISDQINAASVSVR